MPALARSRKNSLHLGKTSHPTVKRLFALIRRNLLENGQTGKYLKYALGEIILVMIGILLALQVNNWNEKRQAEAQFRTRLEQLYTVIDEDLQTLQNIQRLLTQQFELALAMQEREIGLLTRLGQGEKLPDISGATALVMAKLRA